MKAHPYLDQIRSFPSLPGVAIKLLGLVDDPQMSVSKIETVLRHDPGLTANVLKLANSVYFGIPFKVGSIQQAVILLGLKRLIQMVIASCVRAIMEKPIPGYDLASGQLWQHSIAVSVAAEGLVKALNADAAEEIFTAALLHDVGKLVLGKSVEDGYKEIETVLSRGLPFEAAEKMVLGTDHADIGSRILGHWALPPEIVKAVRWHHEPESVDTTDIMLDIVHVANVLCLMMGFGSGRDGLQYRASARVIKRLGLKSFHLEKVAGETWHWVKNIFEVLYPGE